MGKASGAGPIGAILAIIAGLAALESGFPFPRHPAAGNGITATTSRHPAKAVSSWRPRPVRPVPLAGGAACDANLALGGSGTPQVAVTCPGKTVRTGSPSPGVVTITFAKDVSACAAIVTPHLAGLALGTAPGEVAAQVGGARTPGLVTVRTFSQPGVPALRGFSLVLTCPA